MTIMSFAPSETAKLSESEFFTLGGGAPPVADPDVCRRIREVLAQANYTERGVCGLLGIENLSRLRETKLPAMLWRTRDGSPLETLVRLFVLDQPADLAAVEKAIGPMTAGEWKEMGLIHVESSTARGILPTALLPGFNFRLRFSAPGTRRPPAGLRQGRYTEFPGIGGNDDAPQKFIDTRPWFRMRNPGHPRGAS